MLQRDTDPACPSTRPDVLTAHREHGDRHWTRTTGVAVWRFHADFNKDFLTWAQPEMKAGKTVEDAADEYEIPAKYAGDTNSQTHVKFNVQVIYNELKKWGLRLAGGSHAWPSHG